MTLLDQVQSSMFNTIGNQENKISKMASNKNMTSEQMMQFNMQVSKYSTMLTLTSDLIKNLTSNQKSIAQNMR